MVNARKRHAISPYLVFYVGARLWPGCVETVFIVVINRRHVTADSEWVTAKTWQQGWLSSSIFSLFASYLQVCLSANLFVFFFVCLIICFPPYQQAFSQQEHFVAIFLIFAHLLHEKEVWNFKVLNLTHLSIIILPLKWTPRHKLFAILN